MRTVTARKTPVWRAAADGVAHASLPLNTRTLCGDRVTEERFAWPREEVCPDCLAKVRAREAASCRR